jgi:hypothetical protein
MNLDLNELLGDWGGTGEEVCARLIEGLNGDQVLQLRVDLGLLQMSLDGRPDGQRYRGLPSVYDFFIHEEQAGGKFAAQDWRELHRELQQYNYRRLALSSLAEETLREGDLESGRLYLQRTLRDIERCLEILDKLQEQDEEWEGPLNILIPTLIFNRARLLARLRAAECRYEDAIEQAEHGVAELEAALDEAGFESDQRDDNPAIHYLVQMAQRLREQHGIKRTLQEQLRDAIDREDFESAARLRDQLKQRQASDLRPQLPQAGTE